MTKQTELLSRLIEQTHAGPVFGKDKAFGSLRPQQIQGVAGQAQVIVDGLSRRLGRCLSQSLPEMSEVDIQRTLTEVAPKAAAFVPALTAGELTGQRNMEKLTLSAVAVGCMYVADQLTDRGDVAMLEAIEAWPGAAEANPRRAILEEMKASIDELALPDDAPAVLECFDQKVLANEARLHRLSAHYRTASEAGRRVFLDRYAVQIAELMTEDAGFQSVTGVLYAIYRYHNPDWPSVAEVHADPFIQKLLQICNAAARIADEYGDWWMDEGNDLAYGVFSINPFNQYHPAMVARLCQLGDITDASEVSKLQEAFRVFHTSDEQRLASGTSVTNVFFDQMRRQIEMYYRGDGRLYDKYIELCMRVGEISFVNMMGDIQLAGEQKTEKP